MEVLHRDLRLPLPLRYHWRQDLLCPWWSQPLHSDAGPDQVNHIIDDAKVSKFNYKDSWYTCWILGQSTESRKFPTMDPCAISFGLTLRTPRGNQHLSPVILHNCELQNCWIGFNGDNCIATLNWIVHLSTCFNPLFEEMSRNASILHTQSLLCPLISDKTVWKSGLKLFLDMDF